MGFFIAVFIGSTHFSADLTLKILVVKSVKLTKIMLHLSTKRYNDKRNHAHPTRPNASPTTST